MMRPKQKSEKCICALSQTVSETPLTAWLPWSRWTNRSLVRSTALSYGCMWRGQGRDKGNDDVNTNDGNRNFYTGLVSEVHKITSKLEANYQNYKLFVRGKALYDTQIIN